LTSGLAFFILTCGPSLFRSCIFIRSLHSRPALSVEPFPVGVRWGVDVEIAALLLWQLSLTSSVGQLRL